MPEKSEISKELEFRSLIRNCVCECDSCGRHEDRDTLIAYHIGNGGIVLCHTCYQLFDERGPRL
jgi:hypothetical protein